MCFNYLIITYTITNYLFFKNGQSGRFRVWSRRIASIRMGTTVATNALLKREGKRRLLKTTKGSADLTTIGNQDQPNIFELTAAGPALLHEAVVEINERLAPQWNATKEAVFTKGERDWYVLLSPKILRS